LPAVVPNPDGTLSLHLPIIAGEGEAGAKEVRDLRHAFESHIAKLETDLLIQEMENFFTENPAIRSFALSRQDKGSRFEVSNLVLGDQTDADAPRLARDLGWLLTDAYESRPGCQFFLDLFWRDTVDMATLQTRLEGLWDVAFRESFQDHRALRDARRLDEALDAPPAPVRGLSRL
jgi:hypothetical protein